MNGYVSNFRVVKGTAVYTANFTPPTSPLTAITNTSLLVNMTNAGIYDNAMMNDFITAGNAQISTSVKKYGTGSMYFDGASYLIGPNYINWNLNGTWTVEGWFNLVTIGAYQHFVSSGGQNPAGADHSGVSLMTYTNTFYIFIRDASGTYLFQPVCTSTVWSASVTANTFFHLAVVKNGTTYTTYVNGTNIGSFTSSLVPISSDAITIASPFSHSNLMNGYIDDLRITNGYARYTSNFTPPTSAFPNY
jgi:hypothetical protein